MGEFDIILVPEAFQLKKYLFLDINSERSIEISTAKVIETSTTIRLEASVSIINCYCIHLLVSKPVPGRLYKNISGLRK